MNTKIDYDLGENKCQILISALTRLRLFCSLLFFLSKSLKPPTLRLRAE